MSCNGCGQIPGTPLRCGQCKTTMYCSAECQRSDWSYHKRLCRRPSAANPSAAVPASPAAASTSAQAVATPAAAATNAGSITSTGPSETATEEEKLDWYRHREWRPEAKQEFKPTKLEGTTPSETLSRATSKSAWNGADTWEEKNMTSWATQWLENSLPTVDEVMGLTVTVNKVSGDASACFVRGKIRYLFDLELSLKIGNHQVNIVDFCDHEQNPEVKAPRDLGDQKTGLVKAWIAEKRLLFVSAYQQTEM
jgi:hypothetical protein